MTVSIPSRGRILGPIWVQIRPRAHEGGAAQLAHSPGGSRLVDNGGSGNGSYGLSNRTTGAETYPTEGQLAIHEKSSFHFSA